MHRSRTARTGRSQGWPPVPAVALPPRFGANDGLDQAHDLPTVQDRAHRGRSAAGCLQAPSFQPTRGVHSLGTGGRTWSSPGAAAGHPTALHPPWHFGRARETPQTAHGFCGHRGSFVTGVKPLVAGAPPVELPPEQVVGRMNHGSPSHRSLQAAPPTAISRQPRNSLESPTDQPLDHYSPARQGKEKILDVII